MSFDGCSIFYKPENDVSDEIPTATSARKRVPEQETKTRLIRDSEKGNAVVGFTQ
jgi:hypothetical protein